MREICSAHTNIHTYWQPLLLYKKWSKESIEPQKWAVESRQQNFIRYSRKSSRFFGGLYNECSNIYRIITLAHIESSMHTLLVDWQIFSISSSHFNEKCWNKRLSSRNRWRKRERERADIKWNVNPLGDGPFTKPFHSRNLSLTKH